jgi:hypothetical protein
MELIVKALVFYCIIFFIFFFSCVLVALEIRNRNGLILTKQQYDNAYRELRGHWLVQFSHVMFAITFFYYCIPVALYQRWKGNVHARLIDPLGKHPEIYEA